MPVTTADELRRRRAEREYSVIIPLPSGLEVAVRAVNFETILLLGFIPDSLTPLVFKLLKGDSDAFAVDRMQRISEFTDMMRMIDSVVRTCVVQPQVVEGTPDYEAGQIGLDDFTQEDKWILFRLMNYPAQQLESFRQEQAAYVDSLRARQTAADATEQAAEAGAVGEPVGDADGARQSADAAGDELVDSAATGQRRERVRVTG